MTQIFIKKKSLILKNFKNKTNFYCFSTSVSLFHSQSENNDKSRVGEEPKVEEINFEPYNFYKHPFKDLVKNFDEERFKDRLIPSKSYVLLLVKLYFMYWYTNFVYRYRERKALVYSECCNVVAAFIFFVFLVPYMIYIYSFLC